MVSNVVIRVMINTLGAERQGFGLLLYLCTNKYIKRLLIMRTVRPKKFLGQHFLTDLSVARAIADTVDACPDLPVLEVGPGMGVMTQFLLEKPRPLKVVEIDRESVPYLKEHFPALAEHVVEADFLQYPLETLFNGQPFVLTGNYPYNISSQIFFRMLDYREQIPLCTGMIQKEVAERLAAQPGSKTYGILSVLVQLWYDCTYLFTVEPHVFNPPPKVRSAVVSLRRNEKTDAGCDERLFRRVVKTAFNQRRKMMRGSLRPLFAQLNSEQHSTADHSEFLAQPLLTKRPEQLSVAEFVALTNAIEAEMNRG